MSASSSNTVVSYGSFAFEWASAKAITPCTEAEAEQNAAALASTAIAESDMKEYPFKLREGISYRIVHLIEHALPLLAQQALTPPLLAKELNIKESDVTRSIQLLQRHGYKNNEFKINIPRNKSAKESKRLTQEQLEKIKALAPKVKSKELTLRQAAEECGVSGGTISNKLKKINKDEEIASKKSNKPLTQEQVEKIKALAPKIKSGELTQEQAAEECGISRQSIAKKIKKINNGEDIALRKSYKPLTQEQVEKIKALAPKIKSGELTQRQAAEECGVTEATIFQKLKKINKSEDIALRKSYKPLTQEQVEKIKALAPKIKSGELTQRQAAEECDVSEQIISQKLKKLSNGEEIVTRKSLKTLTQEQIDKIKALAPKVKSGELTQRQAAEECDVSEQIISQKLKKLKNGEELVTRKSLKTLTREQIDKIMEVAPKVKIKALISKIKSGELSKTHAAEKCEMSWRTFSKKFNEFTNRKQSSRSRKFSKPTTKEQMDAIKSLNLKYKKVNNFVVRRPFTFLTKVLLGRVTKKYSILKSAIWANDRKLNNKKKIVNKIRCVFLTKEQIEKIKEVIPKIKNGEITHAKAAKECGVSIASISKRLEQFNNGEELVIRKPGQAVTQEQIEKIKAIAPRIKRGLITKTQAARECGVSRLNMTKKIKKLDQGKSIDVVSRKSHKRLTQEQVANIFAFILDIDNGQFTVKQIAEKYAVSETVINNAIKKLKNNKGVVDAKSNSDDGCSTPEQQEMSEAKEPNQTPEKQESSQVDEELSTMLQLDLRETDCADAILEELGLCERDYVKATPMQLELGEADCADGILEELLCS